MEKISFVFVAVLALSAIFAVNTTAYASTQSEDTPTLKQILESVKAYNESVEKDLRITINFSHPDYPIIIPQQSFGTGEQIEDFVAQSSFEEDDKDRDNYQKPVKDEEKEDDKDDKWTQQDFDDKYGDGLPDDGQLDSD